MAVSVSGRRNSAKMEALNKRVLKFGLKDSDCDYSQLLEKTGTAPLFSISMAVSVSGRRNSAKMEALNKRVLKFGLKDNLKKQEQPHYIIIVSRICLLWFSNRFTLTITLST